MKGAYVVVAGLALVLCLALPAWSQDSAGDGPVAVVLWTHMDPGPESSLLDAQIAAFNEAQEGVVVERVQVEGSYLEALERAAEQGALPDIMDVPLGHVAHYAWRGRLASLEDRVGQDMREDFPAQVLARSTWGGALYALPACVDSVALWGNKEYLERAGMRIPQGVEDAWTAEEFEDVLKRLAALPGVEEAVELHLEPEPTGFLAFAYGGLLGGGMLDTEAMSAVDVFNATENRAALELFQSWFAQGLADADLAGDSFERGESGLSWNGQWAWERYDKALGGKLVLLPLPLLGDNPAPGVSGWSWALSAAGENQDAAWAFVVHLLDGARVLQTATVSGQMPARKSVVGHSMLYGQDGPLRLFVAQMEASAAPPQTPASPVLARIFAETLLAVVRGEDVAVELEGAAAEIDRELMRLGYTELPHAEVDAQ